MKSGDCDLDTALEIFQIITLYLTHGEYYINDKCQKVKFVNFETTVKIVNSDNSQFTYKLFKG
jgi:hypothetical protein